MEGAECSLKKPASMVPVEVLDTVFEVSVVCSSNVRALDIVSSLALSVQSLIGPSLTLRSSFPPASLFSGLLGLNFELFSLSGMSTAHQQARRLA